MMTDIDIMIHSRSDFAAFDQERKLPSNMARIADNALNLTFVQCLKMNGARYIDNRLLAWWQAETMEPKS
jgi:hypothetical protein